VTEERSSIDAIALDQTRKLSSSPACTTFFQAREMALGSRAFAEDE